MFNMYMFNRIMSNMTNLDILQSLPPCDTLHRVVGMSSSAKKTERVIVLMSPEEVRAIEDWMFANRLKSQAEAVRRLVQRGLRCTEVDDDASSQ